MQQHTGRKMLKLFRKKRTKLKLHFSTFFMSTAVQIKPDKQPCSGGYIHLKYYFPVSISCPIPTIPMLYKKS